LRDPRTEDTLVPESRDRLAELEFDRSLIAGILEASPDGILVVDEHGLIVSHNQRLYEVLGIAPDELAPGDTRVLSGHPDRPLLELVLERVKHREAFLERVEALYAHPEQEDHCEIEMRDGRTLERHSRALWGAEQRYLGRVWFFRDITARKRVEAALLKMTQHDPLTGVANLRYFHQRAAEELSRARRRGTPLSVVMFDIDHFKAINDEWGHAVGDRVLQHLCTSVQGTLRQTDVFARVGGEEFAVLLPEADSRGAFVFAERLRKRIEAQGMAEGDTWINYTLSAGTADVQPSDPAVATTLERADTALYAAKNAGRNRTHRSP
jgi:diguanylate cyclase (GGDEF)-like protein/PAS domain S-box-containing protein